MTYGRRLQQFFKMRRQLEYMEDDRIFFVKWKKTYLFWLMTISISFKIEDNLKFLKWNVKQWLWHSSVQPSLKQLNTMRTIDHEFLNHVQKYGSHIIKPVALPIFRNFHIRRPPYQNSRTSCFKFQDFLPQNQPTLIGENICKNLHLHTFIYRSVPSSVQVYIAKLSPRNSSTELS